MEIKQKQSKHYKVRQEAEEAEKLDRIENELAASIELCTVQHPADIEDFEHTTNKEFNRNFETALIAQGEVSLKPKLTKRGERNAFNTLTAFKVDESSVKQFTFKQRYNRNIKHGRNTSTLMSPQRTLPSVRFRTHNVSKEAESVMNLSTFNATPQPAAGSMLQASFGQQDSMRKSTIQ